MDKVRYNNNLLAEFLDEMPQAVVWLKPIWDPTGKTIIDFEYAYSNDEGLRYLNINRDRIPGLLLSTSSTLTDEQRKMFFEEMVMVYQTGKKSRRSIYNSVLNKYAKVLRLKFREGILTIVQDVSEENRIIKELEREKTFSNSILDVSLNSIFAASAIRSSEGKITNFLIQRINPAFTHQLFLTEEQVLGKNYLDLFPDARATGVFDMHREVCETGIPKAIEIQSPDNGAWYYISSVKLGDGILVTFQDITLQKQTSDAIERQRNLLRNILDHSPAGISVTEVIRNESGVVVDGRTITANDQAVEFLQLPKEEYLSKTISEIDPDLLTSPIYEQALHTLKTGEPFHTQYYFPASQKWLELSVSKMDDDHLINVFTDITIIKEGQVELERSLQELKRSNANLEEFAYAASHDMKEPLRKVLVFTDLLSERLEGKLSEEDKRYFQRIEKATRRMTLLVEDLLVYAQVHQNGSLEEWVDLNKKVSLVLEDLELMIQEKQAVISVGKLPTVKGHRRQLQQIFTNLITNALKFAKPGEVPHIDIRARSLPASKTGLKLSPDKMDQCFHLIEVEDKGIGFNQKDVERIFTLFTQLHDSGENRGTGVGLAIARKAAENNGGFITAESTPGQGSLFKVYLPAPGAVAC